VAVNIILESKRQREEILTGFSGLTRLRRESPSHPVDPVDPVKKRFFPEETSDVGMFKVTEGDQ
jgi:hypothetical protein